MQTLRRGTMYTLQQIKDTYYYELSISDTERRGLDQYIREEYVPVYDAELNFIGWEHK